MKRSLALLILCLVLTGCTGWDFPSTADIWPYNMVDGGQQFGRDQLANRSFVANNLVALKGKDPRDVLTLLGQPQQIRVTQRNIAEEWYFVYYKKYKTAPTTDEGTFLVQFYNEKVIDVISVS